jgi:YggT family protein
LAATSAVLDAARTSRYRALPAGLPGAQNKPPMSSSSVFSLWYFHLPNFILAALMYTLLGRALLGLMVQPDSQNYIWRAFCRLTDPVVAVVAWVTPKAAAPVVLWLFGFVWLFWLRVGLLYLFLMLGAVPRGG